MNFGDFSVKALLILALALFAVGSSWLAWFENNARLEAEIEMVERRFQAMTKEHQAAIEAADSAIAARNEIYEAAYQRQAQLEQTLANCPDFTELAIPDDLRLQLKEACIRNMPAATRGTAGANQAAKP